MAHLCTIASIVSTLSLLMHSASRPKKLESGAKKSQVCSIGLLNSAFRSKRLESGVKSKHCTVEQCIQAKALNAESVECRLEQRVRSVPLALTL